MSNHLIRHLLVQSLDDLMDGLQLLGSRDLRSLCHKTGLVLLMRLEGALHAEEGLCGGVHFGGAAAATTGTLQTVVRQVEGLDGAVGEGTAVEEACHLVTIRGLWTG